MKSSLPFIFHPKMLIRTPALPCADFGSEKLAAVLLDAKFQQAILLASRELHAELVKQDFVYEKLGAQLRLAAYKYYNRMSYRPTPFGAFASVGLTSWTDKERPLLRDSAQRLLTFPEFRSLDRDVYELDADTRIYLNPSLYKSGEDYRYYARHRPKDSKRDAFWIMKIRKSRLLKKLLFFLKAPVTYQTLLDYLEGELNQANAAELVKGFVNDQLWFHSLMPAIIQQEFLQLPRETLPDSQSYTIAYHDQQGGVPAGRQRDILDGIWALSHLSEQTVPTALTSFIAKFKDRFQGEQIPLLMALDPQMGISYLGTEKGGAQQQALNISPAENHELQQPVSSATSGLILRKLMGYDRKEGTGIVISKAEISALQKPGVPLPFPPSMAVTFRLAGTSILIEQAGGSSAVGIAGRFSHDCEILEALREITDSEQQRNPDVVFAEIAAIDHSFTDNINIRGHFREYQIPLLTHTELPAERLIGLKDLSLQIRGNRLVLRCRRLNKEVVPRLGSAYNYSLSNLPLFRFLGDLQYQGVRADLSFDPVLLLPGLNHYPRVSYRNCILYPATWIWEKEVFGAFTRYPDGMDQFLTFAEHEGLTRFFVLADHDRELVFELSCRVSIGYFLSIVMNKTRIVLNEHFAAEGREVVRDENGGSHTSQLVAFLINSSQVYEKLHFENPKRRKGRKKRHMPGGDWCYFKVYAHLETLNALLRDPASLKLISSFCKIGGIRHWFFVRYADPNPHLRIRFQVADHFREVISAQFGDLVKKYMESGLVSDFLIATYEPELERYGTAGMEKVEAVFQRSSELVLAFHQLKYSDSQQTCFAVGSVALMLREFLPKLSDRLAFVSRMAEGIQSSNAVRIPLDEYYRLQRGSLELAVSEPDQHAEQAVARKLVKFSARLGKFQKVWRNLGEVEAAILLADLIHMHINRLNASGWGGLESATYYLLFKCYRSSLARNASFSSSAART